VEPSPEARHALGIELAAEMVRTFGRVRIRVTGTSMTPSVLPGDVVSVKQVDFDAVSSGDIVVFSRAGRLFAHRVVGTHVALREPHLVTRGDNLACDDPPVGRSELVGCVTSIERRRAGFHPRQLARVLFLGLSALRRTLSGTA